MAYYYKIGLLVLNDDSTKFLVCEKDKNDITDQYIMPGGQMTHQTVEECLREKIKEELDCEVDFTTLKSIGEFTAPAAGQPDREVAMELYRAKIIGTPKASNKIKHLHWISKEDATNDRVSHIIRSYIIPTLVKKDILK
ncbi:MAG: NUDIX domain-containing protein [Candidatus Saccharimonadales bacterium]